MTFNDLSCYGEPKPGALFSLCPAFACCIKRGKQMFQSFRRYPFAAVLNFYRYGFILTRNFYQYETVGEAEFDGIDEKVVHNLFDPGAIP